MGILNANLKLLNVSYLLTALCLKSCRCVLTGATGKQNIYNFICSLKVMCAFEPVIK
jgi:hypothetical protein